MNPYIYSYFDKKKQQIIYIGKTNGRDKSYRTGSKILKRYIDIFGYDIFDSRFDRNIIESCALDKLDEREEYWIKYYNTCINGVNITKGGRFDWKRQNQKPVLQYDLEGNFIKEWLSGREASYILNLKNYDSISACCLGKQKTGGGFIWRFKTKNFKLKIKIQKRKQYKQRIGGGGAISFTLNGVKYISKEECMRLLNISQNKLNKLINENKIL
jgi:hypothetical protein